MIRKSLSPKAENVKEQVAVKIPGQDALSRREAAAKRLEERMRRKTGE